MKMFIFQPLIFRGVCCYFQDVGMSTARLAVDWNKAIPATARNQLFRADFFLAGWKKGTLLLAIQIQYVTLLMVKKSGDIQFEVGSLSVYPIF